MDIAEETNEITKAGANLRSVSHCVSSISFHHQRVVYPPLRKILYAADHWLLICFRLTISATTVVPTISATTVNTS